MLSSAVYAKLQNINIDVNKIIYIHSKWHTLHIILLLYSNTVYVYTYYLNVLYKVHYLGTYNFISIYLITQKYKNSVYLSRFIEE